MSSSYIIDDGILDDETNKQSLYNSRTIDEEKKFGTTYDCMREKLGRKKPTGKVNSKTEVKKRSLGERRKT